MCKILKSVRFEARVLNIIEKQPGDNFSVKLNSYVYRCSLTDLKSKEKVLIDKINVLKKYITTLEKQLDKTTEAVRSLIKSKFFYSKL